MASRKADLVPLFRSPAEVAEEIVVGRRILPSNEPSLEPSQEIVDLAGKPKVVMCIGLGGTGKTTWLRWAVEALIQTGRSAVVAAVDPENRALKDYFDEVHEPDSHDPAAVARWLGQLIDHCTDTKMSACIDFGGGDTSLGRLITEAPDLAQVMEEAGVAPVALYFLTPRIDDLSPLSSLEEAGFRPRATAIVLNEGRADPTVPREHEFARTMRHKAFRSAIERGAIQLWMPKLYAAKEVEDRRIWFGRARDGTMPQGRKVLPLSIVDRSRVHHWLNAMAASFAPIASWMP
ncbi:MAG: hypothetical protein J2P47_14615 [Acetobacteraceae bacterium]|nr:hypothetical protein [Acetobacteraceae bacterium]